MSDLSQAPDFEVRCERCNVSFPVGTRSCLHCGDRIGRSGLLRFGRHPGEATTGDLTEFEPPGERTEADDVEPTTGRPFRFGVTLIWLVALVLSALNRACQGSG